jgi:WD40 repeat protein
LKSGKTKATIRDEGHLAVLTPDGKYMLTAFGGGSIGVWRASGSKEELRVRHRQPHAKAFVISPDGKTLAYVADNSRVALWDLGVLAPRGK